jgi:hypothetical protein
MDLSLFIVFLSTTRFKWFMNRSYRSEKCRVLKIEWQKGSTSQIVMWDVQLLESETAGGYSVQVQEYVTL